MSLNPKIVDWFGRRVWLVGASTGIGAALARDLHERGAQLALSGRRLEALQQLGLSQVRLLPVDVTDAAVLKQAADQLLGEWGSLDLAIYLAGDYTPMRVDEIELTLMQKLWEVNYSGGANLTAVLMTHALSGRVHGLALVASVAGYRGLPRALAYGPPKAALIHLAEILHLELAPKGIGVWLINPGFVSTRLTAKNDFSMPALQTPEQAATAIVRGLAKGGFEIDFPRRFSRLLRFVSRLPDSLYFRLVRRFTGG